MYNYSKEMSLQLFSIQCNLVTVKKSLRVSRYNFKSIKSSNFCTSLAATIFSQRSLLNGIRWANGMDPGL